MAFLEILYYLFHHCAYFENVIDGSENALKWQVDIYTNALYPFTLEKKLLQLKLAIL